MSDTTTPAPRFAVVGHPNKGKSSIVATLAADDRVVVSPVPGTTTVARRFPMTVDGRTLYELVDTPGFQRARRALDWLKAHAETAEERPAAVRAFVAAPEHAEAFPDEVALLGPLVDASHPTGLLYVVDGSVPYGPEYEAEMEILRWTGRPSLALINPIGSADHVEAWRAALGQYFSVVRTFNAVTAEFSKRLELLRAFGQLDERAAPRLGGERQPRADRGEGRRRRGFEAQARLLPEIAQPGKQGCILHRDHCLHKRADGAGHQHRGLGYGEPVCRRAVVEADVVDADRMLQARGELDEQTGRRHRLHEDAADRISEQEFEAERDAARRAADPAGQVDMKRVRAIDRNLGLRQLAPEVEGRRRIAEEEVDRTLVIHEMRVRPVREGRTGRRDGAAVIARMLHDPGAEVAQAVLLPGLGVVGHVNLDREAQRPCHHADAEAEIARAADRDRVARERIARVRLGEAGVGVAGP